MTMSVGGEEANPAERWHSASGLRQALVALTDRQMSVIIFFLPGFALLLVLLLRAWGTIAHDPLWVYCSVAAFTQVEVMIVRPFTVHRPPGPKLYLEIAGEVTAVMLFAYETGWGPELIVAFVALGSMSILRHGSGAWKAVFLINAVALALGQTAIAIGLAPSKLRVAQATTLAALGFIIFGLMIGMMVVITRNVERTNEEIKQALEEVEHSSRELASSEERFRSLVQHASDTTMLVSGDGFQIVYVSPACQELLGCPPERLVGMDPLRLIYPEDRELVVAQMTEQVSVQPVVHADIRMSTPDGGEVRHVEAVISDMRENPAVNGFVINVRDISERKAAEEHLEFAAFHDTLTGLANRALILDRTEQLLARSRRQGHDPAVLFIDLDNFKDVNDSLGHAAGDSMLLQVANRLTAAVRESDTVGRMGGDEFIVLIEGPLAVGEPERITADLLAVFRDLVISGPEYEHPITVSASIGIAVGRRDNANDMIRDADIALYQAKRGGKRRSVVFTPEMAVAAAERLQYESDLHRAVDQGEFFLVYQPLFDLDPVAVYGVEALLRWRHPERGIVSPVEFIPALEENGLILEVGRWVLDEACRQLALWEREGHDLTMSVNVSMAQFETDQIVADVAEAVAATGCNAARLVVEITESMLMSDPAAVLDRLRQLKDLGVRIAVDDFGTGYSSLAYLAKFPVDEMKIDRTFISSILESRESNVIVKSFVDLGHALGIGTLAEGIEDHTQLEMLQSAHCLRGQGFLVSRPLAAEALVEFLQEWKPTTHQVESLGDPVKAPDLSVREVHLAQ